MLELPFIYFIFLPPPKDGGRIENYFTYDFDLEGELSTLRRRQVRPYRDPRFDWQYGFVPLEEYLQLAKEEGKGVYVEIKHGDATNRVRRRFENFEMLSFDIYAKPHNFGPFAPACVACFGKWLTDCSRLALGGSPRS